MSRKKGGIWSQYHFLGGNGCCFWTGEDRAPKWAEKLELTQARWSKGEEGHGTNRRINFTLSWWGKKRKRKGQAQTFTKETDSLIWGAFQNTDCSKDIRMARLKTRYRTHTVSDTDGRKGNKKPIRERGRGGSSGKIQNQGLERGSLPTIKDGGYPSFKKIG